MNNAAARMTGVGCFADGVTLSRVLRRMMDAYSLGDWKDAEGSRHNLSPAVRALQTLMTAGSSSGQAEPARPHAEIAGFFLNFENERLNLSVFTRGRGGRCQKYSASLEDLTRLRHSRLH